MKNLSILFLFVFTALLNAQSEQEFFLNDWNPKTIENPEFLEESKPTGDATVTVTVNMADTVTKVPKFIYGNNANTWSTIMYNNPTLMRNIRNLNPHILRYPGGNLSNSFFWNRGRNQRVDDMPSNVDFVGGFGMNSWEMGVDDYYIFLDSTDTEGLICVNYSYARYGQSEDPVAKAAHMAAEWVRYDNGRTRFWEIGNENYGNWQAGYEIDTSLNQDGQPAIISGAVYGEHALVFIDSMKAAAAEIGHEIYIGLVAFELETSWDVVQTNWNETMMPIVGDAADFYTVHNYYTPYQQNTPAIQVLGSYTLTRTFKRTVLNDLADAGIEPMPLALTEWNIFAEGSMQQVSHINGLHAALVLGESIKEGYGMTNRWDLANGWSNGNDHGMFSRNGEPGVPEFHPRPAFYTMTWFQRYFGDVMVSSEVDGGNTVVAFASAFNSGQSGVVIVNRGNSDQIVELNFDNFNYDDRYYWYTFIGGEDNGDFSRKTFINDEGPFLEAGGPPNYNDVRAYSNMIEGGIKNEVPAFSMVVVLVEGNTEPVSVRSGKPTVVENFQLYQNYPNPFNPDTEIIYEIPSTGKVEVEIYDILGSKVKTLFHAKQTAGAHKLRWDATDDKGQQVASGVYIYKLKLKTTDHEFTDSKRMILVK